MADADRIDVRTSDPLEAAAAYTAAFPDLRVDVDPLPGGPFAYAYRRHRDPRFELHRMGCTGALRAAGPIPESVAIGRHRSGRMGLHRAGRPVDTAEPFLRPVAPSELRLERAQMMLVTVEPAALRDFTARSGERAPAPGAPVPAVGPARGAWRLVMDHADALADDPGALRRPGAATELFELLCWSLVRAFEDPWAETAVRAQPSALGRALVHLDEHAHEAVSVLDAAEAARVSPRQLHLLFRRELGTTPYRYLTDLRLDRARTALARGTDGVAEVAAREGFGHVGRFAAEYRRRFGEVPSETLRRALG